MSKITGVLAPHRILAGLFCTALLAGLACSGGDPAPEPPQGAEAPAAEEAEAPTPPAGDQAALSKGEIPADFPSDLPVYPGSEAGSALGIPGAATLVTFSTDDSVADVTGFLEAELPKNGWAVTDQAEGSIAATKDSRSARFRIREADGGGSTIAVSITSG